jgi:hypothetical protein
VAYIALADRPPIRTRDAIKLLLTRGLVEETVGATATASSKRTTSISLAGLPGRSGRLRSKRDVFGHGQLRGPRPAGRARNTGRVGVPFIRLSGHEPGA